MPTLSLPVVSTDRFTFVADGTPTFVAEASDLPDFARIWADACDVGFTLRSARTGRDIIVGLEREERDGEGELLGWELRPVNVADRDLFMVMVVND